MVGVWKKYKAPKIPLLNFSYQYGTERVKYEPRKTYVEDEDWQSEERASNSSTRALPDVKRILSIKVAMIHTTTLRALTLQTFFVVDIASV